MFILIPQFLKANKNTISLCLVKLFVVKKTTRIQRKLLKERNNFPHQI